MDNSDQQQVPVQQLVQPTQSEVPVSANNSSFLKTLSIGLGVVGIGLAIGVGGYFLGTNKNQKVSSSPVAQLSPTPDLNREPTGSAATANWKTYTNSQYSLEFKYPESFVTLNESHDYISPYNLENLIILVRKQGFQNAKARYSQAANFAISTSSNLSNCYSYNSNKITDKQTINGVEYYVSQSFGVGAGNAIGGKILRVIKNNFCFEVSSTLNSRTGSGEGLVDLMPQVQQDENNLRNELDQILSTFKFTQ